MPTTLCLNAEQIQQFLLGLAPRAEAEALARHLEECPACSDLADSLSARDSLVEAVEQAKTPIPIGVEPVVVETMIAPLQALAAQELDTSPGGWIRPDRVGPVRRRRRPTSNGWGGIRSWKSLVGVGWERSIWLMIRCCGGTWP